MNKTQKIFMNTIKYAVFELPYYLFSCVPFKKYRHFYYLPHSYLKSLISIS